LLKKAAGVEKGSSEPNRTKVGKVTRSQVREIAEIKMKDTNGVELDDVMRQVEGTARNMGLQVSD
jgi:large subunit ribosomal protein L11